MENQAESMRVVENFDEIKRHAELKWQGIGICPLCHETVTLNGWVYRERLKWFSVSLLTLSTTYLVQCSNCGAAWALPVEGWQRLEAVVQMLSGSEQR
jgi:hypothetical protein